MTRDEILEAVALKPERTALHYAYELGEGTPEDVVPILNEAMEEGHVERCVDHLVALWSLAA